MRALAIAIVVLGIAVLVDRQINQFRYTNSVIKMTGEIKRNFLGRS
jgi:hypothetical protein